jgi:hypothetical protein
LKAIWNDDDLGDFLQFDRIENKLSARPDLHAMIRLNELFPGDRRMVSCAAHDEIWFDIDGEKFAEIATPQLILELRRCGVRWDTSNDCLAMFV